MEVSNLKAGESVAIISDIHGNLAALEEVLADISAKDIKRIWCLGDIMGYAPDAVACARLVQKHCEVVLAGNHDLAILDKIDAFQFNGMAQEGVFHAQNELSKCNDPELISWLNTLEPTQVIGKIGLFHASPVDPVWNYVMTEQDAHRAFFRLGDDLEVCLVGHSHLQLAFVESELNEWPTRRGGLDGIMNQSVTVANPHRLLANPGSAGQPRNGAEMNPMDGRVGWGVLTNLGNGWQMDWHHTEYDIDKTMARVLEYENLSELIGSRLYPRQS